MTKVGWGQRLRQIREAVDRSRKSYATIYGRRPTAIQEHESEVGSPQLVNLIRLRADLGVNLNWLATGEGTMFGESPLSEEQWRDMRKVVLAILATGQPVETKAALIVNSFREVLDAPKKPEDSPIVDMPEADNDDRSAQSRHRKDPA